tara:strand:+ start:1766 stop:2659 length:894 start_codon:yes stop_codon:yes gene_type:complete
VSNLNNISNKNIFTFVDLVNNIWKFKKIFFYILVSLLLLSIFLDSFIQKKNIVEVKLKDSALVNLELYPLNFINKISINLGTLHLREISYELITTTINYHRDYFEVALLSTNNLIDFARISNKKYNLYDYVLKNKFSIKKVLQKDQENVYRYFIILPEDDQNQDFFKDYLIYTKKVSMDLFQHDVIRFEVKNLGLIERDEFFIDQNYNFETSDLVKKNIEKVRNFHKIQKIVINDNISKLKNIENLLIIDWLTDGPTTKKVNEKIKIVSKYILPIILSLIFYLFYILIRFTKQDKQS